ncbi:cardiac-enriched FHL2-interacting protein [Colossoma macropomum]|uniref:cardiac-enriched FHL2-interacting protein n=1 Tax=Colossoma macropomum TaxID=42526 RepID=UPI0018640240|nr:cardiac-enriched FHL2-interacting protein [Colossoma macropomum]XP_036429239.1 cardiac-enriched FHL2-interacting protein [Colossoma macropomum]XP_036429240.1 cardiac-enriched FHL2-interacting protein [Colossoma macropomum]
MNCLEKRHVSHKANMQHLGYLDSFMDETDREVMNLTDRAFKSLCIGDEAIYNDSEFSPSPVSCHKPLAEEVPKKTQENSSLAVKKHGAHPLNGVNKSTSLFAAFMAKKNGDTTKTINGDSWDKSALLSIQRELSDFSSDFQISQVKNHLNPSEKSNKSSKDTATQSGKSTKGKHSKSSKLKKLNSKNFFLHSEFSPFQSWRDLNKFPFGLENMEIFQSNGPPEWYDSPIYKKLTMSHRSHVPEKNKEEMCQNTSLPAVQDNPEPEVSQQPAQTLPTVPLKAEIHTKTQPQVLLPSSGSEQRCQSEGDHCAPWRKNRNRAKSAVPIGQPLMSSLVCEQTKAEDEGVLPNKKEVRTMEEQASSSSTPFSILHLLTPVIPSRQGTGNSEVLQGVFSPSTLDLPPLPETEMRPSPEIKREGYKSMASSLLFNLKDNRKRVKAMYSPPRFKGLDSADQSKLSPLIEQVITKSAQEVPEIPEAKIPSPVHQKVHASSVRLLPESADQPNSQSGHINGVLPDDFLALSLLQAGSPIKPLKSKSSAANKPTYPSLNMYRKASPDIKTMSVPDSHPVTDKNTKQGHSPEKDGKELQRKPSMIKPATHRNNPADNTSESTHMNYAKTKRTAGEVQTENAVKEKYPLAVVRKHNTRSDALTHLVSRNQDKKDIGELRKVEQKPVKDQECLRKEPKHKHLFSARQNNYIKKPEICERR